MPNYVVTVQVEVVAGGHYMAEEEVEKALSSEDFTIKSIDSELKR